MRNKFLIIIGLISLVAVVAFVIFKINKESYIIEVTMVDDRSPDRILTVYNNKNEKIEFKRIESVNGVLLCDGINPAVHFGDIEGKKKLKVILKDNKTITAKIVEKEVK